MLIENLQTAESNGVVTASFKSENAEVKLQISLIALLNYKDEITPNVSDRDVFKYDLIWILTQKFATKQLTESKTQC